MTDWWAAAPASLLALVTTIHVAMLVLRRHRSVAAGAAQFSIVPSIAFTAGPWVFPAPQQVLIGLLAHGAWFAACEKLLPASRPPVGRTAAPAPRPEPARPSRVMPAPATKRPDFAAVPVLAVHDESDAVRTFRLARPDGFCFQAGQFLTVQVQVDGRPHVRCYSISSAPEATGYLELSIRRQGLVSGMLHTTVRPGSSLMVRAPAGKFVYPTGDDRPIVLVAGGVGVTPLMSMLRHAVMADPTRPITLLYSVRDAGDVAFGRELELLGACHPQVRVAVTVTGSCNDGRYRQGRIDQALVLQTVPMPQLSIFLICGPLPMISAMQQLLADLGVPAAQVRSELFEAPVAIGARPSPAEPGAAAGRDGERVSPGADRPTLTLARSRVAAQVAPDQTLLEAAEEAGASIPCMCRAGVCGACRTRLVSGDARCESDALGADERAAGYVLPCVTWAESDCTLEA